MLIDYSKTFEEIKRTRLSPWLDTLPKQVEEGFDPARWGDLPKWVDTYEKLPPLKPSTINLRAESVLVGKGNECGAQEKKKIEELFRALHPWRKGPFEVFGVHIDTEWRSDLKWNRLKDHITPLKDRLVLDVGSGNGYYCMRMAGEGAQLAIGIDPTLLYVVQFHALAKFMDQPNVCVLPLGIDDMPKDLPLFDTVFSMGLLYHRRAPFDHLLQLSSFMREDGELILETLVIDGKEGEVLAPTGRYAMMPNVWFIPSVPTLVSWLKRMGFNKIRLVDVTKTTFDEQRATDWMVFQSLADFLDPNDPNLTIEGYPAPKRAIFLANKA